MVKLTLVSMLLILSSLLLAPAPSRADADPLSTTLSARFVGDSMAFKAQFYERRFDTGQLERTFDLAVQAEPNDKYAVYYDGRPFATIYTNANGYGYLRLKSAGKAETSEIPAIIRGGLLAVGPGRAIFQP